MHDSAHSGPFYRVEEAKRQGLHNEQIHTELSIRFVFKRIADGGVPGSEGLALLMLEYNYEQEA